MGPVATGNYGRRPLKSNSNMDGVGVGLIIGIMFLVFFVLAVVACNNQTAKPARADVAPDPPVAPIYYSKENPKVLKEWTVYKIYVREPDGSVGVYTAKHWDWHRTHLKFSLVTDSKQDHFCASDADNPFRYPNHAVLKIEQYRMKRILYHERVETIEKKITIDYKEIQEWVPVTD